MLTAVVVGLALAGPQVSGENFKRVIRKEVQGQYLVSLPKGYNEDRHKKWPVILFLHGSGERGTDLNVVKVHGPIKEVEKGRDLPFIIVAPQCPPDTWWDTDMLGGLMDAVERKYRVDKDREYLTGLSMGGFGTWALAIAQPKRFAAIAPVCGGGDPRKVRVIKDIPTWVVHGDADQAVNIKESQEMVAALQKLGATPRFDTITGGGHDVWTDFYAKDEFYAWLLAQSRKK